VKSWIMDPSPKTLLAGALLTCAPLDSRIETASRSIPHRVRGNPNFSGPAVPGRSRRGRAFSYGRFYRRFEVLEAA